MIMMIESCYNNSDGGITWDSGCDDDGANVMIFMITQDN